MGGSIRVESDYGRYTEFTIEIPEKQAWLENEILNENDMMHTYNNATGISLVNYKSKSVRNLYSTQKGLLYSVKNE